MHQHHFQSYKSIRINLPRRDILYIPLCDLGRMRLPGQAIGRSLKDPSALVSQLVRRIGVALQVMPQVVVRRQDIDDGQSGQSESSAVIARLLWRHVVRILIPLLHAYNCRCRILNPESYRSQASDGPSNLKESE